MYYRLNFISVIICSMLFSLFSVSAQTPNVSVRRVGIPAPRPNVPRTDSIDVSIPLRSLGRSLIVDVAIDGKGPFGFILDTGASGGVIHASLARELNLAIEGEILVGSPMGGEPQPARLVTCESLEIGALELNDITLVAMDQGPFFSDQDGPRGAVSLQWFENMLVALDFPSQTVSFKSGELSSPDEERIFRYGAESVLPTIPVRIGEHTVECILDSGSPGTITLPSTYQDSLNLANPPVEICKARTPDAEFSIYAAPLKGEVAIGGYRIINPEIRFSHMHRLGEVGAGIMEHLRLTFDVSHNKVLIEASDSE